MEEIPIVGYNDAMKNWFEISLNFTLKSENPWINKQILLNRTRISLHKNLHNNNAISFVSAIINPFNVWFPPRCVEARERER